VPQQKNYYIKSKIEKPHTTTATPKEYLYMYQICFSKRRRRRRRRRRKLNYRCSSQSV